MTTTEAIVTEIPKDDKEAPAMGGGMGGMGGMDYWGSFAGWTIIPIFTPRSITDAIIRNFSCMS